MPTFKSKKPTWQPKQNRFIGWAATTIGFVCFVGAIIPAIVAQAGGPYDYLYIILSIVMFGGGGTMIIHGKRHLTRRAEDVLANDSRAPIIYLRSFGEEADDFGLRTFFRSVGTAFTNRSLGLTTSAWDPTFQSQLGMVMERIGPYVAVGRPGTRLPGTGAARLYIPDAEWQHRVSELLRGARLVIIRAGISDGLKWEIENVMSQVHPNQVLIILPIAQHDYATFRDLMASAGIQMPVKPPKTLLMSFDGHWQPIFLETAGKLENTLSPYFRQNGIKPPHPSIMDAIRLIFR